MMWCNRFVFIHIPRTGGDSLTNAFSLHPSISRDVYYWKHARAADVRATLCPEQWNAAYKFTVIRHPWDVMRSWYNHCCTWNEDGDRRFAAVQWIRFAARVATLRFPKFVEMELARICGMGLYDFYCNTPGVEPLTLTDAHARLCEIMEAEVELPHDNASRNFIDDEYPKVRAAVESQCRRDLDLWRQAINREEASRHAG